MIFSKFLTRKQKISCSKWIVGGEIAGYVLNKEVHIKNYDKLCFFTHISSFTRCSESKVFENFSSGDEQTLAVTIKYAIDSCFYLRNEKFFDKVTIQKLDDAFSAIAPVFLPRLARLIAK